MSAMKKVQLNLSLPERCRDMLRRLAAERMIEDPKNTMSAAKVGAEIICDFLRRLETDGTQMEKTT